MLLPLTIELKNYSGLLFPASLDHNITLDENFTKCINIQKIKLTNIEIPINFQEILDNFENLEELRLELIKYKKYRLVPKLEKFCDHIPHEYLSENFVFF